MKSRLYNTKSHSFTSQLCRFLGAVAVTLSTLSTSTSYAEQWNIDQLMHRLAQIKTGRVNFTETKTMAILDRPIQSSGDMFYSAPDRLEKRTIKPKPEMLVVVGNQLFIEKGKQKHQIQLQDYPEVTAFIDSVRGTLAGDRKALERSYQLSLEGSEQAWTLQLLPTNLKMKQTVSSIRIAGARDEVRNINITQIDGDSTRILIEKVATQ
jgi:outer membrane lipoprotein-sorting protein